MSKREVVGRCDLCAMTVYRGGDGIEKSRCGDGGTFRPHAHRKPFTVKPLPDLSLRNEGDEQDNDRGWMDYARRMGAL